MTYQSQKFIRRVLLPILAIASICGWYHSARAQATGAPRSIVADMKHTSGPVDRFFDLSVGADYSGTLIRDDSQAQLKLAVDELGFRYLRFHDIFHDVLGTVRIENGMTVYNWSKIDQLYDDLEARHIKPFVELGFTPKALATSEHIIFHWKGNVSLPNSQGWQDLVSAFLRHIEERYGRDEVRTWFFEVWNEPNLTYFWDNADQKAYFEFYDRTARTVKSIDPALRVGGPATAGSSWVPEFLAHVKESGAPVDFVTRSGRVIAASTGLVTLGNGLGPGLSATLSSSFGPSSVGVVVFSLNIAALALYCTVKLREAERQDLSASLT